MDHGTRSGSQILLDASSNGALVDAAALVVANGDARNCLSLLKQRSTVLRVPSHSIWSEGSALTCIDQIQ